MRGWIGDRGGRRLRRALGIVRLVLAALEIAALVANFRYVLGFRSFAAENFFSYFTVQSAFFATAVLIVSGIRALLGSEQRVWLRALRAAVTSYTLVSGIVFGLIAAQASTRDYRVDVPWSDVILHFLVPAVLLVDWAVECWVLPHTRPIPRRAVFAAVPFPVVWLVFTLMRGEEVGWYPYFFLDPYEVGGWPGILFYCTLVLLILLATTWLLVQMNRVGTRRGLARDAFVADQARKGASEASAASTSSPSS